MAGSGRHWPPARPAPPDPAATAPLRPLPELLPAILLRLPLPHLPGLPPPPSPPLQWMWTSATIASGLHRACSHWINGSPMRVFPSQPHLADPTSFFAGAGALALPEPTSFSPLPRGLDPVLRPLHRRHLLQPTPIP
ncbi:hypothetical protein VPH35_029534 [Triticum aestivum]